MYAVIMAGGSGTRFWPASQLTTPKQFLKITSNRTMLEETIARNATFTSLDRIGIVVGAVHAETTRTITAGQPVNVIVEPTGRNTAPCIGLAALHVKRVSPDEVMIVQPADAFIHDVANFGQTIQAAALAAAAQGAIVTLGIVPTRPETGYGYLEAGEHAGDAQGQPYQRVVRFVEKPNHPTALQYLAAGNFYWNSGIFIFTAQTILAEIQTQLPALYAGLMEIDAAIGTPDYETVLNRVYPTLDKISIDYGVMERTTKPIYVFKAAFGWSDVGSWQSLYELRSREYDENQNLCLGDTLIAESSGNLVYGTSGRKIALLDVEGLVVVDTPEAVMIAPLSRSQDVKVFTEMLKKN